MVIETANFPIFKEVSEGLYYDCYIVGIREYLTAHDDWQPFKRILPESQAEFKDLLREFAANRVEAINLTLITTSGIKQRDFKVMDLLFEKANPKTGAGNLPENIARFLKLVAEYRKLKSEHDAIEQDFIGRKQRFEIRKQYEKIESEIDTELLKLTR